MTDASDWLSFFIDEQLNKLLGEGLSLPEIDFIKLYKPYVCHQASNVVFYPIIIDIAAGHRDRNDGGRR